jgi:hypothetical protein
MRKNYKSFVRERTPGRQNGESSYDVFGIGIVRVREHGEILDYVAGTIRMVMPETSWITTVKFDFKDSDPIDSHSMAPFARTLVEYTPPAKVNGHAPTAAAEPRR